MRKAGLSPRLAALIALEKVEKGIPIQEAVADVMAHASFSLEDRRLCVDMAYGCQRAKIRLNYISGRIIPKSGKLPRTFFLMLEMGIYSLVFQKRVPPHAAINETIKMVKSRFGQTLANVANGALRNLQRMGNAPEDPMWYAAGEGEKSRWRGFSIFYGIPLNIAELWLRSYGPEDAFSLMRRSAGRPWTGLRVNIFRAGAGEIINALENSANEKIGYNGFAFAPGEAPENILNESLEHWLAAGMIARQSPGSMMVMEKLGLKEWNKPVWDCCAGFGGKSAWLAQHGVNVKIASDTSLKRLNSFRRQNSAWFAHMPALLRADASKPPFASWSGNILVDAPCGALGILARRPDIRQRTDVEIAALVKKQRMILDGAGSLLQPGAELAYITCSLNPAENEKLVESYIAANKNTSLEREWQTPHGHPWLEGMYGALLRKK